MTHPINIISISDLHMGHVKTSPEVMHINLQKKLYPELQDDVDLLVFGGDFFDTLLDMSGVAGFHAAKIIEEIKSLCRKHKILLRVVRGTFTHDRHQNQFFNVGTEDTYLGKDLAVRVFNSITVEWIESLGISVLYVPDDLPHENPLAAIKECIADSSHDRVDMAVMHCYFTHLLPRGMPRVPHNCYVANDIIKLVKGPILNGHIHTPRVHKTIITNGSFERGNHGEEENKGFFKVWYDKELGQTSQQFVVNDLATIYKTMYVGSGSDEIALEDFPMAVDALVNGSRSTSEKIYLRVISDDILAKEATHQYVSNTWENVVYTSKKRTSHEDDGVVNHTPTIEELPAITEDTLPGMVVTFAKEKLAETITLREVNEELS